MLDNTDNSRENPIILTDDSTCESKLSLSQQVATLQQQIAELKEGMKIIINNGIAKKDASIKVSSKLNISRNLEQSTLIRETYDEYVKEHENEGFSYTVGPRQGINLEIRLYILEKCRLQIARKNKIDSSIFVFSYNDLRNTSERITNFYYSQKRKHSQIVSRTEDEWAEIRKENNRKKRLDVKWKRRNQMFRKHMTFFIEEYGTEEECLHFLDKDCMSEEEPDEVNAQGQTMTFRTFVPNWRSEKLSKFYCELDELRTVEKRGLAPAARCATRIDSSIPFGKPKWGVNDDC